MRAATLFVWIVFTSLSLLWIDYRITTRFNEFYERPETMWSSRAIEVIQQRQEWTCPAANPPKTAL